jgi:hypothetical protein
MGDRGGGGNRTLSASRSLRSSGSCSALSASRLRRSIIRGQGRGV